MIRIFRNLISWGYDSLACKISKKRCKQKNLDEVFMKMCQEFSSLSKCVSYKVACLLVKDNRIISTGINGSVPGTKNCCEVFNKNNFDREKHKIFSDENEIHAEMNAIIYAAKYGISIDSSVAYCTLEPCIHCCKNLAVTGISRIVYNKKYDRFDDVYRKERNKFLKKQNIKLNQITLF